MSFFKIGSIVLLSYIDVQILSITAAVDISEEEDGILPLGLLVT